MSLWTKERLEQLISDKVEEHLQLEYKSAAALVRTDKAIQEITADVSAFANSSGGVLIYGIAEPQDKTKRHFPERLDPILRSNTSKEWVEQVVQGIQPHVDDITIHPVVIDEHKGEVCYVVEVPQSHTAHQARDYRYYKRHNFNRLPMEDYEVRDVMGRKRHPSIKASVFINKHADLYAPVGVLLVKLENVGHVLAKHVMVEVELPVDIQGLVSPQGSDVVMDRNEEGDMFLFRLCPPSGTPIFANSYLILKRRMSTSAKVFHHDGRTLLSAKRVGIKVHADEMPSLAGKLDVSQVLSDWTSLQPANEAVGQILQNG